MPSTTNVSGRQIDDKFVVRLPTGLRQRIAEEARDSLRSMNSEIIRRMNLTLELEKEIARLNAVIDALLNRHITAPHQSQSVQEA